MTRFNGRIRTSTAAMSFLLISISLTMVLAGLPLGCTSRRVKGSLRPDSTGFAKDQSSLRAGWVKGVEQRLASEKGGCKLLNIP